MAVVAEKGTGPMELTQALTAFYRDYIDTWNGRRFGELAGKFDEPCIVITPGGAESFAARADYETRQRASFADYEARGYSHTTVGELSVTPMGDGMALLDAPDVCRMHRDGSIMERRRAHYVLRSTADGWRFTVVASAIVAQAVPYSRSSDGE